MINEAITKAPVLVFLGAGASQPLGKPLMAPFVQILRSKDPFASDLLFQAIIQREPDLEFLLEELEQWGEKDYYVSYLGGSVPTSLGPMRRVGRQTEPAYMETLSTDIRHAAFLLREVRKAVFYAYRDAGPGDKAVQLFEPLLGAIAERLGPPPNPLVVFTTNYDPAVETFCQARPGEHRLCDGFVQQPNAAWAVWDRESIDHLKPEADPRRPLVLFKLHGSTTWYGDGEAIFKAEVPAHLEDDPRYRNLLIYPAQRKVATGEPYFTAYDYFQRALEDATAVPLGSAKLCIVIGYSFRDLDALSRLRSAARCNPRLQLLVIDPNAKARCAQLGDSGVNATPVSALFGVGDADAWLSPIKTALATAAAAGAGR